MEVIGNVVLVVFLSLMLFLCVCTIIVTIHFLRKLL